MVIEIVAICVVGGGVIVTGIGVIRLWIKNGRDAARRDGAFGAQLKILDSRLEGIHKGQVGLRNDISLVRTEVSKQREHCASVTSGFTERLKTLEKDE